MHESVTNAHLWALQGNKAPLRKLLSPPDPALLEAKDHFGRTPLFYSIMGNSEQCLSLLLKLGARVDNGDNDGQTALHLASHKGLKGCMKLLLAAGAVWHQKDIRGVTPLHLAAHHPNHKALALILDCVPPGQLDVQDSCKRTALHFSATFCNAENIRILLKQDANALIQDEKGQTPLHICASRDDPGALECARVLLEKSPGLINWQDYEGQTALHLAVAQGLEDMVDFLTSRPLCDLNLLDNLFRTPLHWAAGLRMRAMVELLLDRRADPLCADGNGATPLHYSAQQNDLPTVTVLLLRGCPGEKGDQKGLPPLIWAVDAGATDAVRALHTSGISLDYADLYGATALHHGAAKGHNGVVELLLDLGCEVNARDGQGMTPLAYACKEGHAHTLPILFDACASLSDTDDCGRTPLHWAAKENHAYICQTLVQRGCCANTQDEYGRTPLHYASFLGHLSCMSVLLESGADGNILDSEGKTALHWASKAGRLDVVELLHSYQALVNCMDGTVERFTALDYAISGGHAELIQFLLNKGAFTSRAIQEIAASILQVFFKKHFRRRDFVAVGETMPRMAKGLKIVYNRSPTLDTNIKRDSTTSEALQPVAHRVNVTASRDKTEHGTKTKKELPPSSITCDTGSQTTGDSTLLDGLGQASTTESAKDEAACRIQRAWRRYTAELEWQRTQERVLALFGSEERRRQAEEEWKDFTGRLRALGFEV